MRSAARGEHSGCGDADADSSAAEPACESDFPAPAVASDNAECDRGPTASSTNRESFSGTVFECCCDAAGKRAGCGIWAKG